MNPEKDLEIAVDVSNVGERDGDEVVELYLKDEKASTPRPIWQLEAFDRIHLKKGETKTVRFSLKSRQLSMINSKKQRVIEPGWFTVAVGGKLPDNSSDTQNGRFEIKGKPIALEK